MVCKMKIQGTNQNKTQKHNIQRVLAGTPPPESLEILFLLFDVFGSPLKSESFLPYVMFPFMNPFQPAICIISFNCPF